MNIYENEPFSALLSECIFELIVVAITCESSLSKCHYWPFIKNLFKLLYNLAAFGFCQSSTNRGKRLVETNNKYSS